MMNLSTISRDEIRKDVDKSRNIRKTMWIKRGALLFTTMTAFASGILQMEPVYADEAAPVISIEKPSGWKQGDTTVMISVDTSALGEGITITKLEAKVGDQGEWIDITKSHSISISGNQTVYVRVTDSENHSYEMNRSIRCYDTEKPTLTASLSNGVLTIQGKDTVSGIAYITVNGKQYTNLENGTLKIQLTQKDFTTKKIEITATDAAGNVSKTYSLQNPYYEWAVKQAVSEKKKEENGSAQTDADKEVKTPLPQESTPSAPTTSTGTVKDRVVTGIEKEIAEKDDKVDSISSTTTTSGKEFYTISTKSGKTFYLVVDNSMNQDNVYFLTEVDEQDLMNFTLSDTVNLPDVDTVYATVDENEESTEEVPEKSTEASTEVKEEPKEKKEESKSDLGFYLLVGLLVAGTGVGAYYTKIYKPKNDFEEDEYEEYDDSYEEENEETMVDESYEPQVMEDEEDESEDDSSNDWK